MASYRIIYKGPSIEDDPETAGRIADALVVRLPISSEEAELRLKRTPFTLITQLTRLEAERRYLFLKSMGAEVEISEDPTTEPRVEEEEFSRYAPAEIRGDKAGALKAIFYNMAPGLSIIVVILLAGIAQIIGSQIWRSGGDPFWPLSASGWATIALALFILAGLTILRLPMMVRILKSPRQETPLNTLNSYFQAINSRNWPKALQCLALSAQSEETKEQERRALVNYMRKLAKELVLPEKVSADSVSFLYYGSDCVELRISIITIGRQPLSDGTHLRRSLFDIYRFVKRDDKWFLIDSLLLGQRRPSRLPMPACRACGEEVLFGQMTCEHCSSAVPPYAQESEQWLAPRRKPDLAGLLSAVVPGLGQTYNGQLIKAAIIALTSWMILPWAAGVIDAIVVADRINRKSSTHDVKGKPGFSMLVHVLLFVAAVLLITFNAEKLPLLKDVIIASQPDAGEVDQSSVVARFRGTDGDYSILFPYRWQVTEVPDPAESGEQAGVSVRAVSDDGRSTIIISTRDRPGNWNPCPQAIETRRRMEDQGETIANVECGTKSGRQQYRLDSYSADRQWRHSLLVLAYENELVVLAFVCPIEQQEKMVDVFELVANSLRFAEESSTTIRR